VNGGNVTLKSEAKKNSEKSSSVDKDCEVYKNYFDFTIPVRYVKPHQVKCCEK